MVTAAAVVVAMLVRVTKVRLSEAISLAFLLWCACVFFFMCYCRDAASSYSPRCRILRDRCCPAATTGVARLLVDYIHGQIAVGGLAIIASGDVDALITG